MIAIHAQAFTKEPPVPSLAFFRRSLSALAPMWGAALLGAIAAPASAHVVSAYTLMAPDGGSIARVLTDAGHCPAIRLDGHTRAMDERADPRTIPGRTSAFDGSVTPPADFPLRVCEAPVARGVGRASVEGIALPLPRAVIRRVLVIGDTGCRLKAASNAYQACNSGADWPFARLARAAAATHPDLVLHVGDYHYRESPCPEGNAGCAASPWGYGWDAWRADFFTPAAPLLAAAPWAVVRGNHEECARAGAGWWLMLDPHPLVAGADCADPAQFFAGNHAAPYAVELGGKSRIIIADFAAIGEKPLTAPDKLARYRQDTAAITALARAGDTNFVSDHYPFGAITIGEHGAVRVGYPSIAQAFGGTDAVPRLAAVSAVISGHVHLLQYAAQSGRPPQIVAGMSGTQEDQPPAPADSQSVTGLPAGLSPDDLATRYGHFGYVVLDRRPEGAWALTAYDLDGSVVLRRMIRRRGGIGD